MSLQELAIQTVLKPAEAARVILSRDWPREALWTALFLGLVLNTLLYALQMILFPAPAGVQTISLGISAYFGLNLLIQLSLIYGVTFTGRFLSGTARLDQVMALMIWLLLIQAAAHALMLVLAFISPAMAVLMNLVTVVVGFIIMMHFVNEAHRLGSLFRALAVVIMTAVLMLAVLMLFFNLFGFSILGLSANV
jgi:hypothetical protein